jgi:type IV pilus assembly protein PilY1
MQIHRICILLVAYLLATVQPAMAEDTDLFVRASDASQPPDVLLVIDNGANFSSSANNPEPCIIDGTPTALSGTAGGIEQCALYSTIKALDPDSVNIGIMVFRDISVRNYQGVACVKFVDNAPGGCLVYPMQLMTAANKAVLLAWIKSWKLTSGVGNIKANTGATGGVMQEAYAYYNGRMGLSGVNYASTRPPTACSKYIIFIGNNWASAGKPNDQTGNKGPQRALLGSNTHDARMNAIPPGSPGTLNPAGPTTCGSASLGPNNHENNGFYTDEWSRYMYANGITTFSIGLNGPSCRGDYALLLENTAKVGGGKYFAVQNTQELKDALGSALGSMIAKNSVFASVSLPVSVSTQGYYLNQVFIGMFRPDRTALPRWVGNLKQYRLGRPAGQTTGIELQDARTPAQPAISIANSGFISDCALSYWTPPTSIEMYWTSYVTRTCSTAADTSGPLDTPDGDVVEKGGHGYMLRDRPTATSMSRNMMTCSTSACGAVADFNTLNTAITKSLLGNSAMTNDDRTDLINWARGLNNNAEQSNIASTAVRPSVHGDVIHSRPVAINYGSEASPQVVVFYGANDGALRAVNGNRSSTIGSVAAGGELWSFMPPEFYGQIGRLRDNLQSIAYAGNPILSPAPLPKPYGFDGPVTSDVVDGAGGHKWIFATMRRGGRAVYAFDVTNLNSNTSSPTLKWKIGCSTPIGDDSGCATGWSNMGQTWSTPEVFRTAATGNPPMLVMGGGYGGACEDADPVNCTASSKGSSVYVIDADTGAKLREFDLSASNGGRGFAADVFVVPVSFTDRKAKWIYAIDLGGNVYRISGATANVPIGSTPPADWTITRIASLSCDDGTAGCTNKRKFMMAPDVVEQAPDTGVYYLLFGSGDREKPLGYKTADPADGQYWPSAYATTNYFFAIKDRPSDPCWNPTANVSGSCTGHEPLTIDDSLAEIDVATDAEFAAAKGWYLPLNDHEQVVTSAITLFGMTTFSTHTPTVPVANSCGSDTGTARVYNVRYYDAAPKLGREDRSAIIDGGGLPPSPVGGLVKLDGESTPVPFLIGGESDSPLEGSDPTGPSTTTLPKSTTYWYIGK